MSPSTILRGPETIRECFNPSDSADRGSIWGLYTLSQSEGQVWTHHPNTEVIII
ncbi:hypothetical protein K0M31_016235 [Melipona bicolor]|uniref:Uncharacterized protein n=1 Tax=Melipona bicolor TaxID=60889 RepID=A0AA40G6Z6_9HYME|nr:hypothetical protein K0M31_016235 [Melipona bicolor]